MKRAQRASEGSMGDGGLDASSWRCLLAGLASEGLNEEAALVMREMVEAGVRVDEVGRMLCFCCFGRWC